MLTTPEPGGSGVKTIIVDEILTVEKTNETVSHVSIDDKTDSVGVKNSGLDCNSLSSNSDLKFLDCEDVKINLKSNSDCLNRLQNGFNDKTTVNNNYVINNSNNNSSLDDSGKTISELEDSLCNLEINDDHEPLSLILDDPKCISNVQQQNLDNDFYDYEHYKQVSPGSGKTDFGLTFSLPENSRETKVQNNSIPTNASKINNDFTLFTDDELKKVTTGSLIDNLNVQNQKETSEFTGVSIKETKINNNDSDTFTNYQFNTLLKDTVINDINYSDDDDDDSVMTSESQSVLNFAKFNFDDRTENKSNSDSKFVNNTLNTGNKIDNNCLDNSKNDYLLNENSNNYQQSNDNSSDLIKTVEVVQDSLNANQVDKLEKNVFDNDINCDFSDFQQNFQNNFTIDANNLASNQIDDTSRYSIDDDFQSSLPNFKIISSTDSKLEEVENSNFSNMQIFEKQLQNEENKNEEDFENFQSASGTEIIDDDFGDFADFSSAPVENVNNTVELNQYKVEKLETFNNLENNGTDEFGDFADFESSTATATQSTISLKESMCQIENKNVSFFLTFLN